MREIVEGIHTWSWFSPEKQISFNGFYVRSGSEAVVVDPPPYEKADLAQMNELGAPVAILLTNVHHGRLAAEVAEGGRGLGLARALDGGGFRGRGRRGGLRLRHLGSSFVVAPHFGARDA